MQRSGYKRFAFSALLLLVASLVWFGTVDPATVTAAEPVAKAAPELTSPATAAAAQKFLAQHCMACHGAKLQEGKLRLDQLTARFDDPAEARIWIEVMDKVNLGEMPPEDEPRPEAHAQDAFVKWIAAKLREAEKRSRGSGRVVLRRMNRAEYTNTIRDVLGMTFLPGESPLDFLPPDGRADGFDKAASALMVDSSLLDNYYEVAKRIAKSAVVSGPPPFETKRTRFELEDTAKRISNRYLCSDPAFHCREHDVMLMDGGTRSFEDLFYPDGKKKRIPIKGMYAVRVRASADPGKRGEPVIMQVTREGGGEGVLLQTAVTAIEAEPKVHEVVMPLGVDGGEFSVRIVNGSRFREHNPAYSQFDKVIETAGQAKDFATIMRARGRMLAEGTLSNSTPSQKTIDIAALPKLFVDWIEIEGPLYEQWPPKSHEILLFKGAEAKQDLDYAREIFARFLPRAYRRPTIAAELDPIVKLCQQELDAGASFEEAIRVGLTAVLTSPNFVYLFEPSGEEPRELTAYELASRLSYFLWSSPPDDQLYALAKSGELSSPRLLAQQVDRMLKDAKSRSLVDNFAAQWLQTDQFRNFKPDERTYRDYSDKLGKSMVAQSLAFFDHVLRSDLSVLNFIDSDFTLLDETLAKFYGIDGVEGQEFRVVKLPAGSPRGGLLGQAGVMMRGSDGARTKPVSRGVYVREVFFNDPPDPPPPNVGEIEPNIQGKNLTVRDRLIQHQKIEACAACHRGIDPYGLALENFNVIGAWREQQDGEDFRGAKRPPIDSSGKLPNGKQFSNFFEFKQLLLEQKVRLRRGLAEKMFIYALGRPVQPSDRGTIDGLTSAMAEGNDSLRSLIQALVASSAFRTK